MAHLEVALFSRLSTFAGLTALVGTRVYPAPLPQSAVLPAVTFRKIDGPRVSAMGSDTGLTHPRYQIDCFAETTTGKTALLGALDLAAQVRAALQRFRGTVAGVVIQDCFIADERDIERDPLTAVRGRSLDLIVWAVE